MDRLNKKCFLASTGVHLLVALVAFVGPAFTPSSVKTTPDVPILFFEPDILTDSDLVGGGNPRAGRPPQPTPQPQLPKVQEPAPPKPEPKPAVTPKVREPETPAPEPHSDPDSVTAAPVKKPRPNISLVPVIRKTDTKKAARAEAAAREERQAAERLANLGSALKNAGREMGANIGGATSIREVGSYGPGGGGPSYAGYAAYVKSVYDRAWLPPDQTSSDSAVAEVRIVIARDGKVITAEFVKRSRDRQVDDSVQRALDRVPSLRPFPEGAKEATREYILQFDLRVKRGLA